VAWTRSSDRVRARQSLLAAATQDGTEHALIARTTARLRSAQRDPGHSLVTATDLDVDETPIGFELQRVPEFLGRHQVPRPDTIASLQWRAIRPIICICCLIVSGVSADWRARVVLQNMIVVPQFQLFSWKATPALHAQPLNVRAAWQALCMTDLDAAPGRRCSPCDWVDEDLLIGRKSTLSEDDEAKEMKSRILQWLLTSGKVGLA